MGVLFSKLPLLAGFMNYEATRLSCTISNVRMHCTQYVMSELSSKNGYRSALSTMESTRTVRLTIIGTRRSTFIGSLTSLDLTVREVSFPSTRGSPQSLVRLTEHLLSKDYGGRMLSVDKGDEQTRLKTGTSSGFPTL